MAGGNPGHGLEQIKKHNPEYHKELLGVYYLELPVWNWFNTVKDMGFSINISDVGRETFNILKNWQEVILEDVKRVPDGRG